MLDVRPLAANPFHGALLLESRQRLADGRARELVVAADVRLGRQADAGRPPSAEDLVLEERRQLKVERHRRIALDRAGELGRNPVLVALLAHPEPPSATIPSAYSCARRGSFSGTM